MKSTTRLTHQLIPVFGDHREWRDTACGVWEDQIPATPHPTLVTCQPCKQWAKTPANRAVAQAFEDRVMHHSRKR